MDTQPRGALTLEMVQRTKELNKVCIVWLEIKTNGEITRSVGKSTPQ